MKVKETRKQDVLPGFVRLRNGKVRAWPGTRLKTTGVVLHEDDNLRYSVRKLHAWFLRQASVQAELARGGFKDEARRWAMDFNMSGIHHIFTHSRYGLSFAERADLDMAISRIKWASCPDAQPDFSTDLRAIRYQLERLSAVFLPVKKRRQSHFRFKPFERGNIPVNVAFRSPARLVVPGRASLSKRKNVFGSPQPENAINGELTKYG